MASSDFIQRAYIAFFNRPADRAGYDSWRSYSGSDQDLLDQFAQPAEYLSDFAGKSHRQTIEIIYQNLFGRPPEKAGLDYWTAQMDAGWVTVGNAAHEILGGARGTDSATIQNKVTSAQIFTISLDTLSEINAYAKAGANGAAHVAKDWLATVNSSSASCTTALNNLNSISAKLLVAHGYAASPSLPNEKETHLLGSELAYLFPAACKYWLDVGVKAEQLEGIEYNTGSVSQYGEDTLAVAIGREITFSAMISSTPFTGFIPWFIDSTPYSHEEFGPGSAATGFKALPSSAAAGSFDALTVFIHEIGHVIGLGHDKLVGNYDVMAPAIDAGARLLPVPGNLANIGKLTAANPLTMDELLESWMVEGDEANAWHDDTLVSGETWDTVQLVGYADIGHGMDTQIVCNICS